MADIFPAGLSLTGGFPLKGQDLAASIIFLIAYILLLPFAIWRNVKPASRTLILLRPCIFILARIVTWILRAIQAAQTNVNEGLMIGEQILLLCGFILLCEPLLSLVGYHIKRNTPPNPESRDLLHRALILLKLALMVALILGIYAGSQISSVGNDADKLSTLKSCRDANAIICLVITVACILVTLLAKARDGSLPGRATLMLVVAGAVLSIASAYKIYIYVKTPTPSITAVSGKVAFYFLSALPEFLVTALYLSVNLNDMFDIEEGRKRDKIEKAMKKGTYTGGEGWEKQEQGFGGQHEMSRV
ncbi:hypothetical protein BCR35DRAFT_308222 [Leucosporidium creatinivorum]|uniref:Transmembrane protein n=1 Tax=Leucosporidium creatinivorum TaxID=106004 RepID=A0A1Y2E8Z1_9BASI|nr:hypothetical protein BCR35DRAFT_308222 [Leucosporidium creatinivorum]